MKVRLPKEYSGRKSEGNLQQMAKKAQELQEKMQEATERLELKEYTSTSGGGAVVAIVTGALEVKQIILQERVIDKDDKEMLSDLILAAVNEALRLAKEEKETTMSEISGGLEIPGGY